MHVDKLVIFIYGDCSPSGARLHSKAFWVYKGQSVRLAFQRQPTEWARGKTHGFIEYDADKRTPKEIAKKEGQGIYRVKSVFPTSIRKGHPIDI